ncbi:MAG: hypothetical protein ACQEQG_03300 [Bacillota bacterium]
MKRTQQLLGLGLIIFLAILVVSGPAEAVDIGGEINVNAGLIYPSTGDISTSISAEAELELYLPTSETLEPRLVVQGGIRNQGQTDFSFKYLYLRSRLNSSHLTLGRQPVSWSYGAIINPLDFGFGIEGLADRSITPGIDGARYYHSLGSGRSFQAVISWPDLTGEFTDLGYGARLRLPGQGYDFSLNAVSQEIAGGRRLHRAGMTYSGDLGPIGVYGTAGYYNLHESSLDDWIIQLGMDYSWFLGEFDQRRVNIQGEYFRFIKGDMNLGYVLGLAGGGAPGTQFMLAGQDLFIANLSTSLDSFTNIGLALLKESSGWNVVAVPYYTSDLGGGLEFRLEGSLYRDQADNISTGVSAGMIYYF